MSSQTPPSGDEPPPPQAASKSTQQSTDRTLGCYHRLVLRSLPVLLLLSAACGDDGRASADLAPAPDLTGPAPCSDPNPPAGSVCPFELTGHFAADPGLATESVVVSVCAGLCFNGNTDATGNFKVSIDTHILLADFAFEAHGRPDAATYYAPLPSGTGSSLSYAMALPLLRLPASGPEIVDDAAQKTVTGDDITLLIPAATKVRFSVEDFGVPHGHELRTLRLAAPAALPFGAGLSVLYALSPFEAAFDKKVALSIVNRTGLGAGAPVEILVQSGLLNDKPPAGPMVHAANAHVSADGQSITTDPGEGIVELTWIGLRGL
jgi:hypothetical protein